MKRKQATQGGSQYKKPRYSQTKSYQGGSQPKGKKQASARPPVRPEVKSFDNALSFLVDSTGEIPATGQLLTGIVQGTTVSTRVGNKITLSSIQIEGTATYVPGAGAQMGTMVIVKLVFDKQCNGAVATITGDANSIFTTGDLSIALRDLDNQERFEVLKTWKWPFNATAGVSTAYSNQVQDFSCYKKLKNREIHYGASAGAITDLRSGNLFLVAGTDGAGDDATACEATGRINYYD